MSSLCPEPMRGVALVKASFGHLLSGSKLSQKRLMARGHALMPV